MAEQVFEMTEYDRLVRRMTEAGATVAAANLPAYYVARRFVATGASRYYLALCAALPHDAANHLVVFVSGLAEAEARRV